MKNRNILFLKLIISGAILAFLFSKISFDAILNSLTAANMFLVLVALLIYVPVIYLSAFETRYLTRAQEMEIGTFQILKIHLVTSFYGLFLPGSLAGGAVKWLKLSKHGPKADAAAVVVYNRFLEIMMYFFTAIVFVFPQLLSEKFYKAIIICIGFFLIILCIYFILLHRGSLSFIEEKITSLTPKLLKAKMINFLSSIKKFQDLSLKKNMEILAILLGYHLVAIVSFYVLAFALSLNVSFLDIAWMRPVVILLSMLPFSFAGLGVREGSLIYLLDYYGIPPFDAVAFSLLIFFRTIVFAMVGGILEFLDLFQAKTTLQKAKNRKD